MKNVKSFISLRESIARKFNITDNSYESFDLTSESSTILGENIQQCSDFLSSINMEQVYTLQGHKLHGAAESFITGRKEEGRFIANLKHDQHGFQLAETDSGILIRWQLFDSFAMHKEKLEELYNEYIQNQIALDIIQIGWHGQRVAENTTESDLSDVNKGWLCLLRKQRPANFLTEGKTTGQIKIFGENADYANLDHLAFDLKQGLDVRHRDRNDLVFLVGADLVRKENSLIIEKANFKPTERSALASHDLMSNFGGMSAITPPNFPAKCAAVTTLKNLSVYTHAESGRYSLRNNEDRKAVITSYYRQEGYVVEDLGLMTAIDHTKVILG